MKTLIKLSEYRFKAQHLRTFRQLGEFKGRQHQIIRQQPEILDTLRQVAWLESVERSNHLDSVFISPNVVRKLVLKEAKPTTPLERQVAGYSDGLDLVVDPAEHMEVSVGLVGQLHAMLYGHLLHEGGRWRATNKDIIERNAKGIITGTLYRTIPAADIDQAMCETIRQYHKGLRAGVDPLLLISAAILDFLCIHPFSDGNGRISRLLMLLMLSLNGYRVGQFISIERIFAQHEDAYNEALKESVRNWHQGIHNPMPWIEFFLDVLIGAYSEWEHRVSALRRQGIRAPKTQLIRTAIEQSEGLFSVADICIQLPTVSRELVKKVIQQFRDEGLLIAEGRGRGAQWQKTREPTC
ncbi:Fic family protein [Endozoicomonas sp. Mp262]|uniref:Fic family protein n=1 Tax=Endozoicomonas sp. Mp262 TaxID=2919499 RepID=UPI0021D83966